MDGRPLWKTMLAYYELTTACPCSCRHCHIPEFLRHDQPLTRSFPDVAVDLMILRERLKVDGVTFGGGEPTLHPDLNGTVEYALKMFSKVAVISNCVNPQKLEALPEKCSIWVSLDYYGKRQDSWRGIKGLWKNYLSVADRVNIRATLLSNNLKDVKRLIAEASKHNRQITIVPYKGKGKLSPSSNSLRRLLLYILKNKHENAVIDDPSIRMFFALKFGFETENICPAAKGIIRITPEGYVKPCPFLNHTVSHITEVSLEKLEKMRRQIMAETPLTCRDCPYRNVCGGCRANKAGYCLFSSDD